MGFYQTSIKSAITAAVVSAIIFSPLGIFAGLVGIIAALLVFGLIWIIAGFILRSLFALFFEDSKGDVKKNMFKLSFIALVVIPFLLVLIGANLYLTFGTLRFEGIFVVLIFFIGAWIFTSLFGHFFKRYSKTSGRANLK